MELLRVALCGFLIIGAVLASPIDVKEKGVDRKCSTGPQFWCANIITAKTCNAVTHCIQTVWEKQNVPEDHDSICKICLDMVEQARDQLESNQTQSDLRDVFEGSCKLIPVKLVRKECIKMADDFVPELIEALASQMNPQMVCSVAGLCNNANIDKLLAMEQSGESEVDELVPRVQTEDVDDFTCDRCNTIAGEIARKFANADRDMVLENMLLYCGKMSSFSDACASIALTYFNEIYDHLVSNFNEDSICHISGVCANKFHTHSDIVEIRPMGNVGVVPIKDDIPCELCEQLVRHLRDVLIANTTESEFKMVLEGFCKQTGGFKGECLSIVDQYYDNIYNSLVNELDEKGACFLIGICPKGVAGISEHAQIMPLLPALQAQEIQVTLKKIGPAPPKKLLGEGEPQLSNKEILDMQLPIDRIMGPPNPFYLVDNGKWCLLCEYVMHFLQDTISSPENEEKIKSEVNKVCSRIPHTFEPECHNFIDVYGDAIVALLVQDVDPSVVCPRIRFCPSRREDDVEIFAPDNLEITVDISNTGADKPMCPLCLLAMENLREQIKSDRSKANIVAKLKTLCNHLPQKLTPECKDFVDTYSSELVDMLINDFSSEEICVNLRLCDPKPTIEKENNDVLTNEIPDDTVNGQFVTNNFYPKPYDSTPECLLCERVINEVEKKVVNKKSKEQIKHALEHACDKVKKLRDKCMDYVDKHGDQIADLIMKDLAPKEICHILGYCFFRNEELDVSEPDLEIDEALSITVIAKPSAPAEKMIDSPSQSDSNECTLCQFIIQQLEKDLINKKTVDEVKQAVESVCERLPKKISQQCDEFVNRYAEVILSILATAPPSEVCKRLGLCGSPSIELPPHYIEGRKEVIECAICQSVIIEVDKMLSDPKFEKDVEKMGNKVCSILPSKFYKECKDMVDIYGQSMINLILAKSEPEKVCEKIGMCFPGEHVGYIQLYDGEITPRVIEAEPQEEKAPSKPRLVGANECTWGPSHWCASEENAKKCNMMAHCAEKYWKDGKAGA
uniref:Putative saposin n=1 Tax=Phlebotomus kandelakii TaxID=1109342 RepID=A0A6B2EIA5_9DIPT